MTASTLPRGRTGLTLVTLLDRSRRGPNECWSWAGAMHHSGYGMLSHAPAHRCVYELLVGPIPPDLVLDHLCFNRACVNPDHLRVTTRSENAQRQADSEAVTPYCHRGHVVTERRKRDGHRWCRACAAWRARRDRAHEQLGKRLAMWAHKEYARA